MAAQFSSTWATVRKPGIGIVFSLRAQSQPRAPCARERPSPIKISRTRAKFSKYSGEICKGVQVYPERYEATGVRIS